MCIRDSYNINGQKVDSIFAEHDKKIIKTLIERADAKLKPLHLYLQREIQAL